MGTDQPRHMLIADVHIILEHEGQILLGLRQNTGYADGLWHVPAGHLEAGESIVAAALRETLEEVGVHIDPKNLHFALAIHRTEPGNQVDRIGFFFVARQWHGTVHNAEPDKCKEVRWFPYDALPESMVPYAQVALTAYHRGEHMVLWGWEQD